LFGSSCGSSPCPPHEGSCALDKRLSAVRIILSYHHPNARVSSGGHSSRPKLICLRTFRVSRRGVRQPSIPSGGVAEAEVRHGQLVRPSAQHRAVSALVGGRKRFCQAAPNYGAAPRGAGGGGEVVLVASFCGEGRGATHSAASGALQDRARPSGR
jgi:hypothetical protein